MSDTGEILDRLSSGDDRVRADVDAAEVPVVLGELTMIDVEVTNIAEVIRSYRVDVLGLDADYVQVDSGTLDLFPGERRRAQVGFLLPETYPSGRRRIAVEISEVEAADSSAVTIELDLVLDPQDGLTLTVEPATLQTGRTGTFVLTAVNSGNTTLEVGFEGKDPERLVELTFDPPRQRIVPGEQLLVRATAVGKRPWFGMPAVRMLELTTTGGEARAVATVALLQKAKISRRVLTLAGMLLAVTVFALVIMVSFGRVANLAAANEALLKQGLGEDQPVGLRIAPASISGEVTSTTGGGIDGVAVELYDVGNPLVPTQATVTDTTGSFRFSAVPEGEYLVRFAVAGFGETWFPNAEVVTDAEVLAVEPGMELDTISVALAGRPGSVAGTVFGEDVAGAVVAAQIPAESIEGSDLEPVAAVVRSVEVDATGAFVLDELATPATYELLVTQPGFATETRTVTLRPGDQLAGIDVLLRRGDGRLAGVVVDTAGTLLPGVVITATDGSASSETRTLSGDSLGTFELRDLPTPGTYTLSVSGPGFFDETVTIVLEAEQQRDDLQIVLTSDQGSLSGTVFAADDSLLGGVSVTVVGPGIERVTRSVSVGDAVGTWRMSGLPVPASYTVTFEREGLTTQARAVDLVAGPEADRSGVDARLSRATASVNGSVLDDTDALVPGVTVVLESSDVQRSTITANEPAGTFGFTEIPPGAYTLTFRRLGSSPQTLLVDLAAGQDLPLDPVVLERQARITGVVQRQGVPEAGIGVVAYSVAGFPTDVTASTITGAGGSYELVGLDAPETYVIEFQVPAGGPVAGSRTVFLLAGADEPLNVDLQ